MPLENANSIAELNENWPLGTDPMGQGDDHIRLMKRLLKKDVAINAASQLTLAQAQASDLKEGQYVRLTDYGNPLYQTVTISDVGGFYIGLNGDTKLKLVQTGEFALLEHFGVSTSKTAEENAALFDASLALQSAAITVGGPYNFDFAAISAREITTPWAVIDMGHKRHTITDFDGIYGDSVDVLRLNLRMDAAGTHLQYIANLGAVSLIHGNVLDVQGVSSTLNIDSWCIRYGENADTATQIEFGTLRVSNYITNTDRTINMPPTTIIGNFGSSSPFSKRQQISIGNFIVEEFYTVRSGAIVDGESDVLRLFTNPTQVDIGNLSLVNFAKRFLKAQDVCDCSVGVLHSSLDSRFVASSNHIATFDFQVVAQTSPSSLSIEVIDVDYSAATNRPVLMTGTNLKHTFSISGGKYKDISVFASGIDAGINIENCTGTNLTVNATSSYNVNIDRWEDLGEPVVSAALCRISKARVSSGDTATTTARFTNCILSDVDLVDWNISVVAAAFQRLENVTVFATRSTSGDNRVFRPLTVVDTFADKVRYSNNTGVNVIAFNGSSASGGNLTIRDFRSGGTGGVQLGFFTGAGWDMFVDNCDNDTITGVGVNSKQRTTYTAY